MLQNFITWILATVHDWGYTGIFIPMALESTVLPVPSELVLIPAGLARMNPASFALYICLGAGLWSLVLPLFGYFLGGNEALIREYQHFITAGVIVFVALIIGGHVWWQRRR